MSKGVQSNVLITCATVVIGLTLAAATAIFVAAPDGANTGSLFAILMASIPANIVGLTALVKANSIKEDTDQILNGTMDAKMESAIHRAMDKRERRAKTPETQ